MLRDQGVCVYAWLHCECVCVQDLCRVNRCVCDCVCTLVTAGVSACVLRGAQAHVDARHSAREGLLGPVTVLSCVCVCVCLHTHVSGSVRVPPGGGLGR